MHCENCQKKIEGTIGWEKGVKDLKTNLKEKTVTISYDANKTTPEKLQKSIQKLGYQAQQKPLNEKK
jgi:copper chaperone CopZ